MKHRWIAAKRRTVVLVSALGVVGLLVPYQAHAMSAAEGSGTGGALAVLAVFASVSISAFATTKHQGRHQRLARGKSKHHKKLSVGEAGQARTRGKARPAGRGRGRQEKLACAEAFDKAKETVRDFHFRAARQLFARCAQPSCGRQMRRACGALDEQVAAVLPSVVPVVTDAAGPLSRDFEVKMDGEILTSHVDGTAIVVDPGDHEFTFAKDGEVFATRTLAIEKGQRNQIVSVSFASQKHDSAALSSTPVGAEPAPVPEPRKVQVAEALEQNRPDDEEPTPRLVQRGHPRRASVEAEKGTGAPWSAYALAGVGVLGVGGYGVFTLKGRADNDGLVALCKPNCNPISPRHVRNLYLAADISLGIGVAALLASTYLFLHTDSAQESGQESAASRTRHISSLSVEPTSAGALATVGGTF